MLNTCRLVQIQTSCTEQLAHTNRNIIKTTLHKPVLFYIYHLSDFKKSTGRITYNITSIRHHSLRSTNKNYWKTHGDCCVKDLDSDPFCLHFAILKAYKKTIKRERDH